MVAFYLPQFHPIPENDLWWGPGFTEWTNVARARPLYPGHYQPRIPGELGFYDLRLSETREAQAMLAALYGVSGFCYWHYWFGGGRRLLERPFEEVLNSGKPDFPFCLGWANQTWSGIWHGAPNRGSDSADLRRRTGLPRALRIYSPCVDGSTLSPGGRASTLLCLRPNRSSRCSAIPRSLAQMGSGCRTSWPVRRRSNRDDGAVKYGRF